MGEFFVIIGGDKDGLGGVPVCGENASERIFDSDNASLSEPDGKGKIRGIYCRGGFDISIICYVGISRPLASHAQGPAEKILDLSLGHTGFDLLPLRVGWLKGIFRKGLRFGNRPDAGRLVCYKVQLESGPLKSFSNAVGL